MTHQIVFKRTVPIAALSALQSAAPALVAVVTLYLLTGAFGVEFDVPYRVLAIIVALLAWVVLYDPAEQPLHWSEGTLSTASRLLIGWGTVLVILLAIGYSLKFSAYFSRRVILTWALLAPLPMMAVIVVIKMMLRRLMLAPANIRRAVLAGYNEVSAKMAQRLQSNPAACIEVEGFFDDRGPERLGDDAAGKVIGGLRELPEYVKSRGIDVIFIALPMRHVQRVLDLLEELYDTTASVYYLPDIFIFDLIQSRTSDILGMPAVAMCETPFYGFRGVTKRLMDLFIAGMALVILAPLLLVIALLVKLTSPGPVIFKQRRYGLDGEEIHVFKFRTMTVVEDGSQIRQATRDDDRVTPVGRFLRRYSLDELPQLFNVIAGTMSLVGPRPHAVAHNEEYRGVIKGYMIRHKVPPGMTGLAQVSGCRGETRTVDDMKARIEYDLEYLRRWSPLLDIKIMIKTAAILLNDRKAY